MIVYATGLATLLGLFASASLFFTYTLVKFAFFYQRLPWSADANYDGLFRLPLPPQDRVDYTYLDHDYPSKLPDFDLGYVQMSVEESVRFSLWDPEAPAEWATTSPPGDGSVRLGPDGRLFYLSFFHELHCLRRFRQSFTDPKLTSNAAFLAHTQHCLNYLRQCSLCQADRTLELGDFTTRNFTADRVGVVHTCRDWMAVYDKVTYDWSIWKDSDK